MAAAIICLICVAVLVMVIIDSRNSMENIKKLSEHLDGINRALDRINEDVK